MEESGSGRKGGTSYWPPASQFRYDSALFKQARRLHASMGLIRLLIILAIVFLVYRLYLGWQRSRQRSNLDMKKSSPQIEKTVRCQVCQLHIPRTEAIHRDGRYYCSEKHRQQDQED